MRPRPLLAATAAPALALAALTLAAPPRALAQAPAPEHGGTALAPPAVPSFELPPSEPGYHGVRELAVRGADLFGTEIRVKGYITWIYDCAKQIAQPGQTPEQVQRSIDDDPTQCERPKLYLGATKDTAPDRSIWVVSVPRPPRKRELAVLPKDELAKWPAVPKLAVGDFVEITGTWDRQSPHGDRNSDGLLVYKSLQPARPAPPPKAPPPRSAPAPRAARPAPAPAVPSPPPAAPVTPAARQASIKRANEGTRAYAQKQYAVALDAYREAVKTWPDNHLAWYGLAGTHIMRKDWAEAAAAAGRAAAVAPGVAMYHMVHGYVLYEAAVQQAREAQARAEGRKPEEVVLRPGAVRHDAALAALALALHLDDDLWRAHYYTGRILRDRGDAGPAAESFTKAVRRGPSEVAPYVALCELYRRWGYVDEALAIAQLAVSAVADPADRASALYILGAASDDKHDDAAAVDAYTKALDLDPGHVHSRFARGQVYLRTKNAAAAKLDLEAVVASPAAGAWAKSMARQLLFDLAVRRKR